MATGLPRHMSEIFAGACFGSALFVSGVYHPAVILSQLRFDSYHMLQVMLGASAASAATFYLANHLELATIKKKPSSDLGFFAYDGNVVGGSLIGVGMALSGACPGTVVVQVATGISSGLWVAMGGILGAGAYIAAKPSLFPSKQSTMIDTTQTSHSPADKTPSTIPDAIHASERMVLYGWETMCAFGLYVTKHIQSNPVRATVLVDSLWGGPLIGLAQGTSVMLNGHSVGVSGVYEGLAHIVIQTCQYPGQKTKHWWPQFQITPSMSFAAGIFSAAYVLSRSNLITPSASTAFVADSSPVHPLVAVAAGGMMVFGARLCGGCTSGHAISGLATFSISSLVTTAAMFAAGVAITFAMG
nr:uncharacterized protein LOC112020292 [Quercus suber]